MRLVPISLLHDALHVGRREDLVKGELPYVLRQSPLKDAQNLLASALAAVDGFGEGLQVQALDVKAAQRYHNMLKEAVQSQTSMWLIKKVRKQQQTLVNEPRCKSQGKGQAPPRTGGRAGGPGGPWHRGWQPRARPGSRAPSQGL